MNKPIKIDFNYSEKTKRADCIIWYNNDIKFVGTANCSPEDKNIATSGIGQSIAHLRATIKYLRFIRDFEIKPKLEASLQLYYAMNRSKNYNKKSYESKMLYRQIQNYKNDIEAIKEEISILKNHLKDTLNGIEEFKKHKDKKK
ncbi:MAG: hypothetical protein Q4E61_03705 [Alphaproteobacteria bacterium]|nr:hypothetical protein [Alphaproteobacteria bacterium]